MHGREPVIGFEIPEGGDPGAVRRILHAHVAHASIRHLRLSWVHVLAVLGGILALVLVQPDLLPTWLTVTLPWAWACCCAATLLIAARERTWARRRRRLLAAHPIVGDDQA